MDSRSPTPIPAASAVPDDHGPCAASGDPVCDALWEAVEPHVPIPGGTCDRPGRLRPPDRPALNGIIYVLAAGVPWQRLPPEWGYGSGMSCWRRLEEWREAGSWPAIESAVIDGLRRVGRSAEARRLVRHREG